MLMLMTLAGLGMLGTPLIVPPADHTMASAMSLRDAPPHGLPTLTEISWASGAMPCMTPGSPLMIVLTWWPCQVVAAPFVGQIPGFSELLSRPSPSPDRVESETKSYPVPFANPSSRIAMDPPPLLLKLFNPIPHGPNKFHCSVLGTTGLLMAAKDMRKSGSTYITLSHRLNSQSVSSLVVSRCMSRTNRRPYLLTTVTFSGAVTPDELSRKVTTSLVFGSAGDESDTDMYTRYIHRGTVLMLSSCILNGYI